MIMTSLVLDATLTNSYFHFHLLKGPTAFQKIVYARAARPFVYRAFAPFMVRTLTRLTPEVIKVKIEQVVKTREILKIYGFREEYATEYFWAFVLLYFSLLGFALALRKFIAAFYRAPSFLADLAPLGALACLPLLVSYFIYDYPNLFLFTASLLFLVRKDFKLFYPIYILTCFSKETAVLIPFILLLNYKSVNSRQKFWLHLVLQVVIWLTVSGLLRYVFRDNPGQLVEIHLFGHNLSVLANPSTYFRFTAKALPKGLNIIMLTFLAFLTFKFWKEKAFFLRRALFILVPMSLLTLFFGWVDELRVYFESLPIWYTLCLHAGIRIFDIPFERAGEFNL
jgi:hypothetical protein